MPISWGDVFIMFLLGEWVTFCLPGGIGSEAGPGVAPGPPFICPVSGLLLLAGILASYFTPYPLAAAVIAGYGVLKAALLALIRFRFSIAGLAVIANALRIGRAGS